MLEDNLLLIIVLLLIVSLLSMLSEGKYRDELIRNIEKEIDHEEARLRVQVR